MVLDYYKLREQPFGVTADPVYLYLSLTHREALASLAYGIQSGRGFMSLVAKPGMGKTTILFQLLDHLKKSARTVYLFQTLCRPEDLLRGLLRDLGINDDSGDMVRMQAQLNTVLLSEARQGRKVIVVIDEAQNLEDSALELVRMLSNFESTSEKLMQIILAGQPQLGEKLASPQLLQLRQRMSIIARLKPFNAEETGLYIAHRLRVAGYDFRTRLFTPQAEALIARHSDGIPRNINNMCFNALSLGRVLKQRTIEKEVVREVVQDLSLNGEDLNRLRDESAGRKLFAWMGSQPRAVLRAPMGWRKRLAAGAVLLLPLMLFSSGRGPDVPEHATASASVGAPIIAKLPKVVVAVDEAKATDQMLSGPPLLPVASIPKNVAAEKVLDTAAIEKVAKPALVEDPSKARAVPLTPRAAAQKPSSSLGKRVPPAPLDELWAQVRKENSDAEIELARLYLEGSSVPRNCAQAQILLQAAARHGNAHAIDLLSRPEAQCH